MNPAIKEKLLGITDVKRFLRILRKEGSGKSLSTAQVAERLAAYGGPPNRQTVSRYELGNLRVSSAVQYAYTLAFQLDDELRLHLQQLAGEACGITASLDEHALAKAS